MEDACGKSLVVDPSQQSFQLHAVFALGGSVVQQDLGNGLVVLPHGFQNSITPALPQGTPGLNMGSRLTMAALKDTTVSLVGLGKAMHRDALSNGSWKYDV